MNLRNKIKNYKQGMADLKIEFNEKIENFQLKGKYDYLMKGRSKEV